jgi:hypothetical protein
MGYNGPPNQPPPTLREKVVSFVVVFILFPLVAAASGIALIDGLKRALGVE